MDQLGRALARIERRLSADDPVLAEAFALWNERCDEAARSAGKTEEARSLRRVVGVLLGATLLGAAAAIPWLSRASGWW